jgi:hypothetical protein
VALSTLGTTCGLHRHIVLGCIGTIVIPLGCGSCWALSRIAAQAADPVPGRSSTCYRGEMQP